MMKNYKLSFLVTFGLLVGSLGVSAQSVTFSVDMTGVTLPDGGPWLMGSFEQDNPGTVAGNFNGHLNAEMPLTQVGATDIYEITVTVPDGFQRFAIFSQAKWGSDSQPELPDGCEVDGFNTDYYYTDLTGISQVDLVFGGCLTSTYSGTTWDVGPYDGGKLIVNDNLDITGSLIAGQIEVAATKTLTVKTGGTLNVSGTAGLGSTSDEFVLTEDFEGGVVPAEVDESKELVTVEIDPVTGSNVLAIRTGRNEVDPGNDWAFFDFTAPAAGTYNLSFDVSKAGYQFLRLVTNEAGNNEDETFLNGNYVDASYRTITKDFTAAAGGAPFRIRLQTDNTGAPLFIDNIIVKKTNNITTVTFGALVVESGASLMTTSSFDKAVTINRNTSFADGKYSLVGTSVASDPSITGAALGSNVYSYDETAGYDADAGLSRWVDASSDMLMPGIGYTQANNLALSFTGVPNAGDISVLGLTKTTAGTASASDQGWHLLSNPYASAIDVTAFLAANTVIAGSISIWEDGGSDISRRSNTDYITANAIATVNGASKSFEGYIGAMQGFFVQANTDNVDVVFTEAMRGVGNNADANFFRKATSETAGVRLNLSSHDGKLANEIFVGLVEDATIGVDRMYDAPKLKGGSSLQFYSLIDDARYAIQGLPFEDGVSKELAFDLENDTELEINITDLVGLEEGLSFYLLDNVTGKEFDLSVTRTVSFSAQAGSDQNRFTLTYRSSTVLGNELSLEQPIYRYLNNELLVNFNKSVEVGSYAIYDLSGKIILNNTINKSVKEVRVPIEKSGVTILKITTPEGVYTRKFIF